MTNAENPNEQPSPASREDLAESTAAITGHVDNVTEEVRHDLAQRAEVIRDEIVKSNAHVEAASEQKVEDVRASLASETETARRQLEAKTEAVRKEMASATEEVRRVLEEQTEIVRHSLEARAAERRDKVDRKFRDYRNWFVVFTLVMLLANAALFFLYLNPRAGRSLVTIGEMQIDGPTELCPGEYLDFSFEMDVKEAGVYELDASTFRTSPPPSIAIFSERKTFVIGTARTFTVSRRWQVPPAYVDEALNEVIDFVPGSYERNIAVSTISRNTKPSTRIIPFVIREGCP